MTIMMPCQLNVGIPKTCRCWKEQGRYQQTAETDTINEVAVVAPTNIRLEKITCTREPTTFEYLSARVTSRGASCVIIVIYRPGSQAVSSVLRGTHTSVGTSVNVVCATGAHRRHQYTTRPTRRRSHSSFQRYSNLVQSRTTRTAANGRQWEISEI